LRSFIVVLAFGPIASNAPWFDATIEGARRL
jgi:hypothetical protein